jgi:hypothetical protein
MPRFNPTEFVRQFRENGIKMLFHDPGNLRDLLNLRDPIRSARLDFERMTVDPTTYVAADYRHLASDLVLKLPYRTSLGNRRRTLTVYILIEHQSEPDPWMVLRVLEYVVQIYKGQSRAWDQRHPSREGFRMQPVLPIVFYTGMVGWAALSQLTELIEGGREDFADVLPQLRPLFLSLPAIPDSELERDGGFLGWVLELLRKRTAPAEEFRAEVARVVSHLEEMAEGERDRWLMLLSYIQAMIYHDRAVSESEPLREMIVRSVRTDTRRKELQTMTQTIAEALREEGREEGVRMGELQSRREMLLELLRTRFGRVPRTIERVIRTTDDISQLKTWIVNFATAKTLADVGITSAQSPGTGIGEATSREK